MRKFQFLLVTLLSFLLLNEVTIDPTPSRLGEWLEPHSAAYARTGGRSRGGSFSRPSPTRSSPSRSSGSRSSPSRSNSTPSRSSGSTSSPTRSNSTSTPTRSSGSTSSPTRSNSTPSPTDTRPSGGNTGGRVRGGSFDRQPAPIPAPVTPSYNNGTNSVPSAPVGQPNYRPGGSTVVVPVPVPVPAPQPYPPPQYDDRPYQDSADPALKPAPVVPPTNAPGYVAPSNVQTAPTNPQSGYANTQRRSQTGFPWRFILFLLVVGGAIAALWFILSQRKTTPASELGNDIVTVSKLQVALLASAREIQSHLTDLSVRADLDTSEGLAEFLQESALTLLRHPEYWTHVSASSETVSSREEAGRLFEQLSIAERSKFSAETFSNVGGRVRYGQVSSDPDSEPASYIVVTLLIGTQDDKPLFDRIHSAEELRETLQRAAAVTPDYLLVFELLWSPQDARDSLSYDDLLTQYSDMVQIG